jgi:DNA-binding IclR family transcriptional regulator
MSRGRTRKVKRSAVQRIFDVFDVLIMRPGSLRSSQIASIVGLSKATVYRLLKALEQLECVRVDDAKYSLGTRLLYLGEQVRSQLQFVTVSRPILSSMAAALGETVSLGTLYRDRVLIVETVKPTNSPILFANLGPVAELHCSSLGKALLAYLPPKAADAILARLKFEPRTPNTITEAKQFRRELDSVRRNGIAYDREETELGLLCIGVAIRNREGQSMAALSVSGPIVRMGGARHSQIEDALTSAARKIGTVLGSSHAAHEVYLVGDRRTPRVSRRVLS